MSLLGYSPDRGPLAIVRSGLYLADGSQPRYSINGDRLELREGETLLAWPLLQVDADSLWKVYASARRENLEAAIINNTETILDRHTKIRMSDSSLHSWSPDYLNMLRTVLFEAGKYFVERSDAELGHILDSDARLERQMMCDYLESKLGSMHIEFDETELHRYADELESQHLESFGEFIQNHVESRFSEDEGVFSSGNETRHLSAGSCNGRIHLHIGDRTYETHDKSVNTAYALLDEMFTSYTDRFTRHYAAKQAAERIKHLGEDGYRREVEILTSALRKGTRGVEFRFDNWGVKLNPDNVAVYLEIPPYALMIGRNRKRYYLFPRSRVAVNVHRDLTCSSPFLMGISMSPFIVEGRGSNKIICMGTWEKDIVDKLPAPERIAKYLLGAQATITKGYTQSSGPYRRLDTVVFVANRRPKWMLKMLKIPVTNEEVY